MRLVFGQRANGYGTTLVIAGALVFYSGEVEVIDAVVRDPWIKVIADRSFKKADEYFDSAWSKAISDRAWRKPR